MVCSTLSHVFFSFYIQLSSSFSGVPRDQLASLLKQAARDNKVPGFRSIDFQGAISADNESNSHDQLQNCPKRRKANPTLLECVPKDFKIALEHSGTVATTAGTFHILSPCGALVSVGEMISHESFAQLFHLLSNTFPLIKEDLNEAKQFKAAQHPHHMYTHTMRSGVGVLFLHCLFVGPHVVFVLFKSCCRAM